VEYLSEEFMVLLWLETLRYGLESGLPLKSFIDVGSGSYWSISKSSPWTYGEYLVIRKPTDIHQDPKNNLIGYWIRNQQLLMKYYRVAYENPYFMILKK
jgi:hypothetical protein